MFLLKEETGYNSFQCIGSLREADVPRGLNFNPMFTPLLKMELSALARPKQPREGQINNANSAFILINRLISQDFQRG